MAVNKPSNASCRDVADEADDNATPRSPRVDGLNKGASDLPLAISEIGFDTEGTEVLEHVASSTPATSTIFRRFGSVDHRKLGNTANMVAEHCRSRARALAARALLTRVCCVMTGHRNEEPIELMHEDFQVHVDSDWVGDLLERKSTTGVIVRRGIEERVSATSENNVYNIYVKPMSISTCSSIQRC